MAGTLYCNGIVYTADDEYPEADSFVVEDGRFVFVGRKGDAGDFEDMTDLGGRCVIPGLIDSHCHMLAGAVIAALNLVTIDPSTTPAMLGSVLKNELEKQEIPDGGLFAVMGIDLTVGDFSASDIDGYIDDRPVTVFSFDGHALLLNSKAMDELEVKVEVTPEMISDEVGKLEQMRALIGSKIKQIIGINARITLVEPGKIERTAGKAKRVIDLRNV